MNHIVLFMNDSDEEESILDLVAFFFYISVSTVLIVPWSYIMRNPPSHGLEGHLLPYTAQLSHGQPGINYHPDTTSPLHFVLRKSQAQPMGVQ